MKNYKSEQVVKPEKLKEMTGILENNPDKITEFYKILKAIIN